MKDRILDYIFVVLALLGLVLTSGCSLSFFESAKPKAKKNYCIDDSGKLVEQSQKTESFIKASFAQKKVQLRNEQLVMHKLGKAVSAGQNLLMIYDHGCLDNTEPRTRVEKSKANSLSEMAQLEAPMVKNQNLNRRFYAHSLVLEDIVNIEYLEQMAQEDPCIVGISSDDTVEISSYIPNDSRLDEAEHLSTIKAASGWELFFAGINTLNDADSVVIAFVDTGIDLDHEDLAGNLWDDGSGNHGKDIINDDDEPEDSWGHGSHVAGLAAAQVNNSVGIAGVIGKKVKIMAVKVFNRTGTQTSTIINGIYWAVDNGADVLNLSLGSDGENAAYETAVRYAVSNGVVVTTAAGNHGEEITTSNFYSPIGYSKDINGAIAVGSIDVQEESGQAVSGKKSCFSNYSESFVEISAPGAKWTRARCDWDLDDAEGLLSTVEDGSYDRLPGTSMSAPIVAGAAGLTIALLRAQGKDFVPSDIEDLILQSAEKNGNLDGEVKDGNILDLESLANAAYAFDFDVPTPTPTPGTEPTSKYPYCDEL
jgi:subtilisin family serine protease